MTKQRAMVLHPVLRKEEGSTCDQFMEELKELTRSADLEVIDSIVVRLKDYNAATLIGKGKLEEIKVIIEKRSINLVVMGMPLSGAKERNLENILGVPIVDRIQLILSIFASRARSQEGKVQVELAQLEDVLSRLTGKGTALSRLGGGIGTKGPGEKKLETDKRRTYARIHKLKNTLRSIERRRKLQRESERRRGFPFFVLIGYTNAGKSSLFNLLTHSNVVAKDCLFATLDPTVRKVTLPSGIPILLSDTVGIIQDMPKNILDAFKATFEDLDKAHAYIHVIDVSVPNWEHFAFVVQDLLAELNMRDKPILYVLNKIDRIHFDGLSIPSWLQLRVAKISTLKGYGMPTLILELEKLVESVVRIDNIVIPWDDVDKAFSIDATSNSLVSKVPSIEGMHVKKCVSTRR